MKELDFEQKFVTHQKFGRKACESALRKGLVYVFISGYDYWAKIFNDNVLPDNFTFVQMFRECMQRDCEFYINPTAATTEFMNSVDSGYIDRNKTQKSTKKPKKQRKEDTPRKPKKRASDNLLDVLFVGGKDQVKKTDEAKQEIKTPATVLDKNIDVDSDTDDDTVSVFSYNSRFTDPGRLVITNNAQNVTQQQQQIQQQDVPQFSLEDILNCFGSQIMQYVENLNIANERACADLNARIEENQEQIKEMETRLTEKTNEGYEKGQRDAQKQLSSQMNSMKSKFTTAEKKKDDEILKLREALAAAEKKLSDQQKAQFVNDASHVDQMRSQMEEIDKLKEQNRQGKEERKNLRKQIHQMSEEHRAELKGMQEELSATKEEAIEAQRKPQTRMQNKKVYRSDGSSISIVHAQAPATRVTHSTVKKVSDKGFVDISTITAKRPKQQQPRQQKAKPEHDAVQEVKIEEEMKARAKPKRNNNKRSTKNRKNKKNN
ncbi:hypothetical protein PCE1_001929 [Barthelona sp. PCE]